MSRVTSAWDTNRRAAKDNITQAVPVKIRSMPMNKPITQSAEEGHCFQISNPKSKVIAPLSSNQCHSGNRQELLAVPLTSNPNALVMAVQKRVVLPMEMECMTGVPHEQELIEEAIVAEHRILKELFSGAIDTSTDRKVNLSASLRGGVRMT